jgi:hypothetical protein
MKALLPIIALAACGGGDPANVEGNYSIALTNRDNGCMFGNWTEDDTASNIPVIIDQVGAEVEASVEGLTGTFLDLGFGAHVYEGTIDGNDLVLELIGSRAQQMGNCAFTYNSTINARLAIDTLTGRVEYTTATNDNPDCAPIQECLSFQDFNGTRPPT